MTKSTNKIATKVGVPGVNYTEMSQELTELMTRLEQGNLDIDAAVDCYERGLQIVSILETHLSHAENRVSKLRSVVSSYAPDAEREEE